MRIALFTEWYLPVKGGVSSHVEGLSHELDKRGHEVTIFTKKVRGMKRPVEDISENTRIVRISPAFPFNFPLMPPARDEIEQFTRKEKFDIVHSHHAFTAMPLVGLSVANESGIPSVVTNHSIPGGWYDIGSVWPSASSLLQPIKYYLNLADHAIAVSQAAADFISLFIDYAPIDIIPNGIDTTRFTPDLRKDGNENQILFVGRLVHRKGPHVLLKAFKRVLRKEPNAKLTFVGDGYMRLNLESLVHDLGISGNTEFLGDVSPEMLPSIYANAALFALPSLYAESFGMVLLEAMSSGLPVIASRTGGVPEIIADHNEGLLVKPGSEIELASAIVDLLQDKKLRTHLASNARSKAVRGFDWNLITKQIEGIYRSLLR